MHLFDWTECKYSKNRTAVLQIAWGWQLGVSLPVEKNIMRRVFPCAFLTLVFDALGYFVSSFAVLVWGRPVRSSSWSKLRWEFVTSAKIAILAMEMFFVPGINCLEVCLACLFKSDAHVHENEVISGRSLQRLWAKELAEHRWSASVEGLVSGGGFVLLRDSIDKGGLVVFNSGWRFLLRFY